MMAMPSRKACGFGEISPQATFCGHGAFWQAMSDSKSETKLPSARVLARKLGLKIVRPEQLSLARKRRGDGFTYLDAKGRTIKDKTVLERLKKLAMPPAYDNVIYAADHHAH